jgi:hypothetical protein
VPFESDRGEAAYFLFGTFFEGLFVDFLASNKAIPPNASIAAPGSEASRRKKLYLRQLRVSRACGASVREGCSGMLLLRWPPTERRACAKGMQTPPGFSCESVQAGSALVSGSPDTFRENLSTLFDIFVSSTVAHA